MSRNRILRKPRAGSSAFAFRRYTMAKRITLTTPIELLLRLVLFPRRTPHPGIGCRFARRRRCGSRFSASPNDLLVGNDISDFFPEPVIYNCTIYATGHNNLRRTQWMSCLLKYNCVKRARNLHDQCAGFMGGACLWGLKCILKKQKVIRYSPQKTFHYNQDQEFNALKLFENAFKSRQEIIMS